MNVERQVDKALVNHFAKYKQVLILLGPRQVGKTTILRRLFPDASYLLVDDAGVKDTLERYSLSAYKQLIDNAKQVIIDEVHLLSDPGRAIKIIYDLVEDIQIIVTGSSSLHIKNRTGESLAGRAFDYHLFPLTFSEYMVQNKIEESFNNRILEKIISGDEEVVAKRFDQTGVMQNILRFGLYPEILNIPEDRVYLEGLAQRAIFKDIIQLNLIDDRAKALELLKLLAYQIGNLISYNEIGNKLKLNQRTVERYIEIFEQSFIIYRLYPYSKDKRNEIGKAPKVYFYDTGLRNALIGNFDLIRIRPDSGALFENFIINEVKKIITYERLPIQMNYWRTKSGSEVDLVLSTNHDLHACEIKLTKGSVSSGFTNRYPEAHTHVVTAENFY